MSVAEIKDAIEKLPAREKRSLDSWLHEQLGDFDDWDKQVISDIESGKLDAMLHEAKTEYKTGRLKRSLPE